MSLLEERIKRAAKDAAKVSEKKMSIAPAGGNRASVVGKKRESVYVEPEVVVKEEEEEEEEEMEVPVPVIIPSVNRIDR